MKTKMRLLAIISMILSILLLVEVPIGAVAPILGSEDLTSELISSDVIETESTEESCEIISEIEDERTENSKTFRLSDGTNMIAQYNMPVHYKSEKGKWVDYDNTLSTAEEDYSVAEIQSLPTDEATADSVAPLATTNNDVKNNKKQVLKNKRSNTRMSFAQQASQENMVFINNKKHKVSWGYKDVEPKNAKQKNEKKIRTGNDKFTVLDNLTSTVVYESAYKDVDIECITTPVGVKENIILNKKSATNKFVTTYDIGDLRAEKLNDREIALYNQDDKVEYYISALYMFDANKVTSESIVLNIIENANGKLVVELVADEEWLSSKDRKYPVTIDPTFSYGQDWGDVQCTYIDSANPNTAYGYGSSTGYTGTVYTGTYGVGTYRTLMKINELPALNKGDMIVSANVQLPLYSNDLYDDAYVGIYEAESSWNQSEVKWNNKPSCSNLLVDYCNAYDSLNDGVWCLWDITKLVKQWYNGETNNGFYLKMVNESTNQQCVGYYSSNYPLESDVRPVFKLTYRNNKGIEGHWSYTSFSVGNVGTAHINDYSGALTFELPISSTADPYMPAGVSYTYNSYMANTKYSKNAPYFGDGWRMNMQQTLLPSTNYGLTGDDAENYPYVYTDADGTEHYFLKTTEDGKTKYLDEDGLELELTIDSESNGSRYIITDKNKNKWYFHKTGLLNRFQDPYGNKQQVSYDGTKITTVSDKTGNTITFNSSSTSNYVTSIEDPSGRETSFTYDSDDRVTRVDYPDGRYASFTYYSNGLINTISDNGEYKIEFTYDDNGTKSVASVQEYGKENTLGEKITFDRTNYNETSIRTSGVDGTYGNSDDCVTTCQFDDYGRLTGAYSKTADGSDIGAESLTYTSGSVNSSGSNVNTINKVSKHHNIGANAVNYARNTSFETTASWSASSIFGGAEYSTAFDSTQKLYGQKSLKVITTSYTDDGGARRYQDITNLTEGKTYTLSGYLKVTSLSQLAPSNSGAFVAATTYTSSGTEHHFSEYITEVTDININNGWRRVDVTFEVPTGTTKVRLTAGIRGAKGTAYFDAIQVEYGKNVGSYNMIQNASFESNSNHIPTYWSNYRDLDFGDSKDGIAQRAHDGSVSFSIKGSVTQSKALYQEIPVSGIEADTYILSGWAKTTTAIPVDNRNNRFRLSVHVVFAEKDSNGDNYVAIKDPPNFNTSITDWQYSSYAFTLSDGTSTDRTPIAIRVFLTYALQGNRAYFDDVQLVKEPAQSYTYDDEGNLISVVATAEQNTSYEYNANKKVESYTDPKGYKYSYTYNEKDALETYTNARGTKSTFEYDSRGLLAKTAIASSANNKIETNKSIDGLSTANSTYSVVSTDQSGNNTTSVYNSKNGTLQSVTDPKGTVSYTYNPSNDILTSVTQEEPTEAGSENTEEPNSSSVEYTYDNYYKYLLGITTPNNTVYSFDYDNFGNRKWIKAGTYTLATYSYGANNGPLVSMKYGPENGNGDEITYTYDKYGNIRTEKLNGTLVYEGLADKTGAVTKAIDRANNLQYNYVYDSTDRLISSTRTNTIDNSRVAMFEYDFDLNNNLTKFATLSPHGSNVTQHTYGKDNLPATSTFSNNKVLTYSYTSVSLPSGYSLGIDENNSITKSYTYTRKRNGSNTYDNLTNLIMTEVGGGFSFGYVYDEHNNITHIYENVDPDDKYNVTGDLAQEYEYDYLDQLTEAIDHIDKKRYEYTYDSGGNITEEKVYDNSGDEEVLLKTNTYSYANNNWTDRLTSYNGHTIDYDDIGNPLTYRDGITFSWSNGRQLDSYTKGDTNVEYTYDNDGMRLTKTVDGVKYTYLYENGLLVQETRGDAVFDYSYDANGSISMLKYRANTNATPSYFYYALNTRGDVIGLYNDGGTLVVKYTYDPWGNSTSITDTSGTNIANLQPFRYRSYYFDTDSGFYYLQSRYYDPVTHRFINADTEIAGVGGDIVGYNMYAYCNNNPVNQSDPDGHWPKWAKKIVNKIKSTAKKVVSKIKSTAYSAYYNATKWHFEDRAEKNGKHPKYSEVTARNSGWNLLPKNQSLYHDNGVGKPELKYITNDGKEAVFDGDTLEPITDPRYIATYNYCPLYQMPSTGAGISDYTQLIGSVMGHFFADMVPYYLTGNSNTREQFESKIFIFN